MNKSQILSNILELENIIVNVQSRLMQLRRSISAADPFTDQDAITVTRQGHLVVPQSVLKKHLSNLTSSHNGVWIKALPNGTSFLINLHSNSSEIFIRFAKNGSLIVSRNVLNDLVSENGDEGVASIHKNGTTGNSALIVF
jgi:hypothetical protein